MPKRSFSVAGLPNVWWILKDHPYPPNFFEMMPLKQRQAIMNAGGGTARLATPFEAIQKKPISRVKITPERRSANMARIRSADTKREMIARRTAHRLGYRFRLHRRDLPGKPDLVFVSRKKIVFLHGCYWHGHGCKVGGTGAKSNQGYWGPKIARNRERDDSTTATLRDSGWKVLVVWECETRNQAELASRLRRFLK